MIGSYEEVMDLKHRDGHECSDLEWYVVMVAACHMNIEGLGRKDFVYDLEDPGAEILEHFSKKTPPHIAAVEMFSLRH